jgi:hypothetical protein
MDDDVSNDHDAIWKKGSMASFNKVILLGNPRATRITLAPMEPVATFGMATNRRSGKVMSARRVCFVDIVVLSRG